MAALDPAVDDAPAAVHDAPETDAPEAPDTSGADDVSDGPDEEAMAAFLGLAPTAIIH